MDTKAAFEKWWDENQELLSGKLKVTPATAFIIWKASRAAIEIELKDAYLDAGKGKIVLSLTSVLNEMASHGIRIKGKTE